MADVVVQPAFQSMFPDSGDTTKFGPAAWNAARLFSGGSDGEVVTRDSASPTGATWGTVSGGGGPATALQLPNDSYILGRNQANSAWINLFKVNTSNTIDVGATLVTGNISASGGAGTITALQMTASSGLSVASAGFMSWASRSYLTSPADGQLTLNNNAGTGFTRLNFGGASASFPALTRNGAVLETKLADNSAYATHAALLFQVTTAIVAAGGGAAPTFTTIGGSGPATAAQNGWLKFTDSGGAACYVPAWK